MQVSGGPKISPKEATEVNECNGDLSPLLA
jgi:hypothetical protein